MFLVMRKAENKLPLRSTYVGFGSKEDESSSLTTARKIFREVKGEILRERFLNMYSHLELAIEDANEFKTRCSCFDFNYEGRIT